MNVTYLSGTALDYELDDRWFESRQGLGIFLFTTASRPALGPTQPPIQWVPGALALGVKKRVREGDQSPPSSAEVEVRGAVPPLPQFVFMAWCLFKLRDKFTFYFICTLSKSSSSLVGQKSYAEPILIPAWFYV
jgi:hypothetical protein